MLDFFIEYADCEKLGVIDNCHLINADRDIELFAENPVCKHLAKIHGKAVDFAKSGEIPEFPR